MALTLEKHPVHTDRTTEIIRKLTEGKSREEVAADLGYSSVRSMHTIMNRHNFTWDDRRQNYVPAFSQYRESEDASIPASSKVANILSMFAKEGADAKAIAKRMGFPDHRELASYMKGKGYVWDNHQHTYVKFQGEIAGSSQSSIHVIHHDVQPSNEGKPSSIDQFQSLLEMLERNKERLVDLLIPGSSTGQIPRYAVPGIFTTKTVHMTNVLDQMVRDFSREKNISQREIFECALIEFLRRYGYEREVEQLLGR